MTAYSFLNNDLYTDVTEDMEAAPAVPVVPMQQSQNIGVGADNVPTQAVRRSSSQSSNLEQILQALYARIASAEKRISTMEERIISSLEMIDRKKPQTYGCSWWFFAVAMIMLCTIFYFFRRHESVAGLANSKLQSTLPSVMIPAGSMAAASPQISSYPPNIMASGMSTAFIPSKF